MKYEVDVGLYEGPLPLLVELARLNLLDVFLVKLVGLTNQYLAQVKVQVSEYRQAASAAAGQGAPLDPGARLDVNQLSEPLPLLGNLVALKARGLLPKPPETPEDEEVPVSLEELERRLKEYEQFKTVAQLLSELHALQHLRFPRVPGPVPDLGEPAAAGTSAFQEVGVGDLVSAFSKVLERSTATVYEVNAEQWTVEMKVQELRTMLMVRKQVRFLELFTEGKSRLELVATFLAVLELIRQSIARAIQEQAFHDILITMCAPEGG